MTNQTTSTTLYRRIRDLECRGAVESAPSEEVEGVLLVGTQAVLSFYDHESSYGEDYSEVFPAFHNGNQCWLRRDTWNPSRGYSASGTSEYILSFEEGVKLLIEREVFSLPNPEK